MNRAVASGGSAWTSPNIIMAAISMAVMVAGSYLALQRDDTQQVRAELNAHARQIAIMETNIGFLLREREERRERDRRADE